MYMCVFCEHQCAHVYTTFGEHVQRSEEDTGCPLSLSALLLQVRHFQNVATN